MIINEIQKTTDVTNFAPPLLEGLIDNFISAQDVKPSSRALYRRTLTQYLNWTITNNLDLKVITRIEILRYKDDMFARGLSGLSVSSYLTVVRKFYEWTEASKLYPNVARGIKTPRRKQTFRKQPLSINQSSELLTYFKDCGGAKLRDYAIINLLLRTGLRTVEVTTANVGDITMKQGKLVLLVQGKGEIEKNNFVILTEKAFAPIQAYLLTRPNTRMTEPLFTSMSHNSIGQRLTTRTISKIAKDGLKAIGLDSKHITAHSLRHTLAVTILKAGGSIMDVQGVLRHSNPATTQIYTRSIDEEIRIRTAPEELIESLY